MNIESIKDIPEKNNESCENSLNEEEDDEEDD